MVEPSLLAVAVVAVVLDYPIPLVVVVVVVRPNHLVVAAVVRPIHPVVVVAVVRPIHPVAAAAALTTDFLRRSEDFVMVDCPIRFHVVVQVKLRAQLQRRHVEGGERGGGKRVTVGVREDVRMCPYTDALRPVLCFQTIHPTEITHTLTTNMVDSYPKERLNSNNQTRLKKAKQRKSQRLVVRGA